MKRIVIWECLSRKRDDVMKLLLHACCGPCACYPAEKLLVDGKAFDILYFNPNIHPYKEFKRRLNALRELCEKKRYKLIVDKSYPLETCVQGMLDERNTLRLLLQSAYALCSSVCQRKWL